MRGRISVAMIVRDEAAHLAACLESAAPLHAEICIVDTGSTDDTAAIARQFTDRIGAFSWNQDFSAARNASLRLCTRPWILLLDADERLDPNDIPRLTQLAEGPENKAYRLMTRNYTNEVNVGEFHGAQPGDAWAMGFTGWFPSWKVRLFPNKPGVAFYGHVHESVRNSLQALDVAITQESPIIYHYPLLRDPDRIRAKRDIYLRLGLAKVQAHPEDSEAHAELGHQYAELGEWVNALQAYRAALERAPRNAVVLKDLGGALQVLGRANEARQALELALRYDPGLPDAWRNLGIVLATQGQWADALACFQRALEYAPDWPEGFRYTALALGQLGQMQEAREWARKAVQANPASTEAQALLTALENNEAQ